VAVKYLVGGPVLLLIGHVGGIDAVGRARFVISLTSNDLEMSFREDRANAINLVTTRVL